MELLKKVANDRLVIMVTHNPELAKAYSTRIVNLKDGKIIGDSNPLELDEKVLEKPEHKNLGKASMSYITALLLSFNNLLTKKGRTILTAFAGSIGIIGIALILALSTGFQNYIDKIQEDTLSSYPLTITKETADRTSMLLSMVSKGEENEEEGVVKETQSITSMFSKIGTNDLKSFKKYLEDNQTEVDKMVSNTQYNYSVSPLIYTKDSKDKIIKLNPSTLLSSISGTESLTSSTLIGSSMSVFKEMIDDKEMIKSQYDILAGRLPENYDEVILILPDKHEISDLLAYSLGLRDSSELQNMIAKIMAGEAVENKNEPLTLTYEELMNIPLKLVDATATYKYNSKYKIYESMESNEEFMENVYNDALTLKIVGIICVKEDSTSTSLTTGIAYTKNLTKYVIEQAANSEIVKKQLADETINVFTNKNFDDESKEAGIDFQDMVSIDKDALSSAFGVNISEKDISNMTSGYMKEISKAITTDTTKAQTDFNTTLVTLTKDLLNEYIAKNGTMGVATIKLSEVDSIVNEFMKNTRAKEALSKLTKEYKIPQDNFDTMYSQLIKTFITGYVNAASTTPEDPSAIIASVAVNDLVDAFVNQSQVIETTKTIASKMTEANMQTIILTEVGELTTSLMSSMANSFNVDQNKIASAFKVNITEEEIMRLVETMSSSGIESASSNLISLGYQEIDEPSSIAFYFNDFDSKELFIEFLDKYNEKMESEDDEKVIKYTDITGVLMSSVSVIVDSVTYVLIAFVSISLVVSSIMIGIITYISVFERTKEIGILRAIGASKKNISSIFNAETFIVGLFSGIIGILVTLVLLVPINQIIHNVTGNLAITAVLPTISAVILVILSVILTLIGGLIPSKTAAKKDPVLALRSE